ncbi:MAG: hypothetical protein HPZ91_02720 [Lentisphaeria bacterium]|nr:hypothetical protein [Lentisphaeria bacterium]
MKKHFTLTEILVVVFLIGVLTAIGFGMYSYAMNSAKESSTKALIARLGAALESCNTKLGYIPTGKTPQEFNEIRFEIKDGSTDDNSISELSFTESFSGGKKVEAEYLKEFLKTIDAESLRKNLQKSGSYYVLVDGWGNKIYYAYPGKFNATSYDLYSFGADGRMGKDAQDATAQKLNASERDDFKASSTNELLSDDVFNF